jgi:hypothetical protein
MNLRMVTKKDENLVPESISFTIEKFQGINHVVFIDKILAEVRSSF